MATRDIPKAFSHITVNVLAAASNLIVGVSMVGGVQYLRCNMKASRYESFCLFYFIFIYECYDWDDQCVKPHN